MNIKDLHGKIEKCWCTNSDPAKPMPCSRCFCRGFVAECLQCSATGQIEEVVVGGAKGTMKSTCPGCGGTKVFGVNKPADWDTLHPPVPELAAEVQESAEEPKLGAAPGTSYPDAKTALAADPTGWQQPPLRPTGNATA